MSDQWILRNTAKDNEDRILDSEEEAKETKNDIIALGAKPENLEIIPPDDHDKDHDSDESSQDSTENTEPQETQAVEPVEQESQQRPTQRDTEELHDRVLDEALQEADELAKDINRPLNNPLATLPDWMLTEIQHGRDTSLDLNKDGSQVIANALNLAVSAECEVSAKETDFEYCRYRATVATPDGKTYNAVGDCRIDETGKNHNKWDLERKAETRAKKRAVKWATGGGIEAFREYGDSNA